MVVPFGPSCMVGSDERARLLQPRILNRVVIADGEIDGFLLDFPDGIRRLATELRGLVFRAQPVAVERVRPGWRLIGYDIPVGRRTRYFAYIAPEIEHIHLGFEHGTLMTDPARMLEGAHLHLRKVRYLTYRPAERIPREAVIALVRQAASIAAMPRSERSVLALLGDLEVSGRADGQ